MIYAKGVSWITDTRIPFVDEGDNNTTRGQYENKVQVGIMAERPNIKFVGSFDDSAKQGRFTPNLLVCDDMLNDGSVSNSSGGKGEATKNSLDRTDIGYGYKKIEDAPGLGGYGDKGTNSRYYNLDLWFNKMVDEL